MTSPNRNPIPIKDLGYIMGMNTIERECCDATLLISGGAKDLYARNLFQSFKRIFRDLVLMFGNGIHAKGGKIINRRPEADRFGNRGSACLKFVWQAIRAE